jgi:hypothetical protein
MTYQAKYSAFDTTAHYFLKADALVVRDVVRDVVQNVEKLDVPANENVVESPGNPPLTERQVAPRQAADQCRKISPRKIVKKTHQQADDYITNTLGSTGFADRRWTMATVRLGPGRTKAIKAAIEGNHRPASSFIGRCWDDQLAAVGLRDLRGFSFISIEPDRRRPGEWHAHVLVPAHTEELPAITAAAHRLAGRDAPARSVHVLQEDQVQHWQNRQGARGLASYSMKGGASPWRTLASRTIYVPHKIRQGVLPPQGSVLTDPVDAIPRPDSRSPEAQHPAEMPADDTNVNDAGRERDRQPAPGPDRPPHRDARGAPCRPRLSPGRPGRDPDPGSIRRGCRPRRSSGADRGHRCDRVIVYLAD